MNKPNNILERQVRDELESDYYVDSARIDIKADNGKVSLSGVVFSYPERMNAEEDAWSVSGVKDVENSLTVGPLAEAVADVDIAAECAKALDADRRVPKGAVMVRVLNGWVTLSGRVRRHVELMVAKHDVGHVHGVLGVTSNVIIDADPIPSDVAARITSGLERSSLLHDSAINVSNSGSAVFLDGSVGSYAARQRAEDVAWNSPGVTEVVDRLEIVY